MSVRFVEKPWVYEEIWAETDRYVAKYLYINSGHRLSRQYHKVKDETIRVLNGTMLLEIGDAAPFTKMRMIPGDTFHVMPGTVHRFCAEGSSVLLVEVSTPELDDVVRLDDDYSRKEGGSSSDV